MRATREKLNAKGITLVALVITIVVLLILAGISLNLVIGNNGIITKAQEAKKKYAEGAENDLIALNALTDEIDEYIQSQCEHEFGEWQITKEATESEEGIRTKECIKCGKIENQIIPRNLKIGERITGYNPAVGPNDELINTSYESTVEKNGYKDYSFTVKDITDWVILGNDSEGRILITSIDPIKTDADGPAYFKGYPEIDYVGEMHRICSIYGQGKYADRTATGEVVLSQGNAITSGARSITLEDVGSSVVETEEATFTSVVDEITGEEYVISSASDKHYSSFAYHSSLTDSKNDDTEKWIYLNDGKSVTLKFNTFTPVPDKYSGVAFYRKGGGYMKNYNFANVVVSAGSYGTQFGAPRNFNNSLDVSSDLGTPPNVLWNNQSYCRPVVTLDKDVKIQYDNNTKAYSIID